MSRRVPRGGLGPEWPNEPDDGQAHGDQGVQHNGYRPNGYNGYNGNGNGAPGQDQQQHQYGQYGGPGRGGPADYGQQQPYGGQGGNGHGPQGYDQPGPPPGPGQGRYDNQPTQTFNYQRGGAAYQGNGGQRGYNGDPRGYQNGGAQGNMRRYEEPQRYDDQRYDQGYDDRGYEVPGQGPGGPALFEQSPEDAPPPRKVRFRRTRRLFRRRSVRIVSAVIALFLVFVMFSAGQAAFKNNGQGVTANLAEWARDHYLGPVVTFGEWLSYNPPPKGGKPSFSLAVPSGEAVSSGKPAKTKAKDAFVPDIPATLKSLAGSPIAGEGQWRVVGEGQRRAGDPDDVPARRDVHVPGQRHRVDRPAAGQVLAAPGHGRPGTGEVGRARLHPGRPADRAARHVQRRVQAGLGGRRLLPERHLPRRARERRRVGRLLQERHGQDRRVGPGLHHELLDRRRQAEPQAAR